MTDAKSFWAFLGLSFGITWAFCAVYFFTRSGVEAKPGLPVRLGNLAAVWGPSIAGFVMAWTVGNRQSAMRLLSRYWQWPGWKWLALAAVIPLSLQLTGAIIGSLITPYSIVAAMPPSLQVFLLTTLFALLSGPLGEELGWRGFGLDTGARVYGPLTATAIIGVAWSLWHLPAFVVPGLQNIIFPMGISFLEFAGFTLFGAVILSWITFRASGAIGPAVISHLSILMTVQMVKQTPPLSLSLIVLTFYAIAAALIVWREPDLGYASYLRTQNEYKE